jgi:predicted membrane channel-forming protein YqfA (hemolysin III family)
MKTLQFTGIIIVIAGSFLPLVHVPVIGYWDYWHIDHRLAITAWLLVLLAFVFTWTEKKTGLQITALLMLLLFALTIMAVKTKSSDFFSFVPVKAWQSTLAGTVTLSWGWFLEFLGAVIIFLTAKKRVK